MAKRSKKCHVTCWYYTRYISIIILFSHSKHSSLLHREWRNVQRNVTWLVDITLDIFRSSFCFHIQNIHHFFIVDGETFKEKSLDDCCLRLKERNKKYFKLFFTILFISMVYIYTFTFYKKQKTSSFWQKSVIAMTFRIVLLTKWTHLVSILSIKNIEKCLEFEQINKLISGKLENTR